MNKLIKSLVLILFPLVMLAQDTSIEQLNAEYFRLTEKGDHKEALFYAKAAAEMASTDETMDAYTKGEAYNNYGLALQFDEKDKQAMTYLNMAVAEYDKAFGPENGLIPIALNNIALLHYQNGETDQAVEAYNQSIDINSKLYGADDPRIARDLEHVAKIYDNNKQYDKAEPYYKRVLEIKEKHLEPGDEEITKTLTALYKDYLELGMLGDARLIVEKLGEKPVIPKTDCNCEDDLDSLAVEKTDALDLAGDNTVDLTKSANSSKTELEQDADLKAIADKIAEGNESKEDMNEAIKEKEEEKVVPIYYTVKSGDSLYEIAKKYSISVATIKTLNNMKSNTIHPGKKIRIK